MVLGGGFEPPCLVESDLQSDAIDQLCHPSKKSNIVIGFKSRFMALNLSNPY